MQRSTTRLAAVASAIALIAFASPANATGSGLRGRYPDPSASSSSASNSAASTASRATGGRASNRNTNSANNSSSANGGNAVANNTATNNSSSRNSQRQRQSQRQSLRNDSSNSNNSSQSVNVNNNNPRQPVSTAYAGPLVTGEDTCMGSSSLGAQAVTFGLSLGTTWRDANCRRLKNSRQLVALGYQDAAAALMCADADVRRAMEEAGTPCPVQSEEPRRRRQRAEAPAHVVPAAAPACPTEQFIVYFDWDRSRLTREATQVIDTAATRARQCGANQAIVIGHTDTSGSNAYNVALSQRRTAVVRDGLISRGVDAAIIRSEFRGETDLARATGDGIREQANRRTAITIAFR